MDKLFKRQGYHIAAYIVLGIILYFLTVALSDSDNSIWGISVFTWVLISWICAGFMQFWVVIFWRLEYFTGKISKLMGKAGFVIFRIGFIISGLIRLSIVIPVSRATAHTVSIPLYITVPLIAITAPFIVWGLFSVLVYFGITRAFGADHFDSTYRNGTLELRGIYKYIPNSMYTVILLVLYFPGLIFQSLLGLVLALVHHLFVWVHYFCTERPDLIEIYGPSVKNKK